MRVIIENLQPCHGHLIIENLQSRMVIVFCNYPEIWIVKIMDYKIITSTI